MAAFAIMPSAFLSNVLIGLNDLMLLFLSNHKYGYESKASFQDLKTHTSLFLWTILIGLKNPIYYSSSNEK